MLKTRISEEVIRFACPRELKETLIHLAYLRNISLSALIRIALIDYIKHKE